MGGVKSKTANEQIITNVTNSTTKLVNKCVSGATQEQLLSFKGISGDLTIDGANLTQGSSINISCLLSSENQNQLANDTAQSIVQVANTSAESVLSSMGNTSSDVKTNIKNEIINNITTDLINEVTGIINQKQGLNVADVKGNVVIKNFTATQTADMAIKSVLESSAFSNVINKYAAKIDQSAKTVEVNPISSIITSFWNGISSALQSIFNIPAMIAIVVIAGVGGFAYYKYNQSKK